MKRLSEIREPVARTERVLQFGEGNFLRAFVDWMIQRLNDSGKWSGSAVMVQPIARGLAAMVNENRGLYTVVLRGLENGSVVEEATVVDSVSRCIDPYADFASYMACADNPELRFVVSNTTEAGIAYQAGDRIDDAPPASFPAKLTAFLHRRWQTFGGDPAKGLVMIPCELIDRNGDKLKETVLRWADEWGCEESFVAWLAESCAFLNSLVDRIVTGYPGEEAEAIWTKLGYRDDLLDTAEPFQLWVIEGDKKYAAELPLHEAGCSVLWTDDMTPYRTRKVRILNGAHTSSALAAFLAGFDTVREMVEAPVGKAYLERALYGEIMPVLTLPKEEVEAFAAAVLERFANPFIKHRLLDITLNSVSKFKARVLPSLLESAAAAGKAPRVLSFGLGALMAFYRGTEIENGALLGDRGGIPYHIKDDLPVLQAFAGYWKDFAEWEAASGRAAACRALADAVLGRADWWDRDIRTVPGLLDACAAAVETILTEGAMAAMERAAAGELVEAAP